MDSEALVALGHKLLRLLDQAGVSPVFGAWMHNLEIDVWKLWIVPKIENMSKSKISKEDFFLTMSKVISENREYLDGLDIGMVTYKPISDRVVEIIGSQFKCSDESSIQLKNCTFNGLLIEECLIIRSEL